jgi:hypothetical protein
MVFFFWLYFSIAIFLLILCRWHPEFVIGVAASVIGMSTEFIRFMVLN